MWGVARGQGDIARRPRRHISIPHSRLASVPSRAAKTSWSSYVIPATTGPRLDDALALRTRRDNALRRAPSFTPVRAGGNWKLRVQHSTSNSDARVYSVGWHETGLGENGGATSRGRKSKRHQYTGESAISGWLPSQ